MTPRRLDHVALYVADPQAVASCLLAQLPFRVIVPSDGRLVDSFDEVRREVVRRDLPVNHVVDAENSRALFLAGPDGVELEYIEHKLSFALA